MVRASVFYAWTPIAVVVGTAVVLTIPWLAVIALAIVVFLAAAALAWAIVVVPYRLSRAVARAWRRRGGMSPQPAPTLLPARRQSG